MEPLGIDGAWTFIPPAHRDPVVGSAMTADPSPVPVSVATSLRSPRSVLRGRWGLRSRWGRRVLIALLVLFALFCGATARLFIWPTTGMPARVDAIVVPGGTGNRIAAAIALAEQGRARYLVLSEGEPVPTQLCGAHVGAAAVLCFMPNPDTTQGEAEATARLAKEYGSVPSSSLRRRIRPGGQN